MKDAVSPRLYFAQQGFKRDFDKMCKSRGFLYAIALPRGFDSSLSSHAHIVIGSLIHFEEFSNVIYTVVLQ